MELSVEQITFGPAHHFFGYIGHCMTVPWDGSGRYMLCLETGFQDRMPTARDAAGVMLIDAQNGYSMERVAETRAWNPQQGTMLYWNPLRAEREFFFNDRDAATGEIFTVLFDAVERRRVREFRFPGRSLGNGGVAPAGGRFAAINYGRLARLRPVTGYPEAADWTVGVDGPEDDGLFVVDVESGKRELVCAYPRMMELLVAEGVLETGERPAMFLNHTLWNRESDRILFYPRAGPMWGAGAAGRNVNCALTVRPDGSELRFHGYVGGHAEWDFGSVVIAEGSDGLRLYDVNQRAYIGVLGSREVFSDPKGDKALSLDGEWLVHGNTVGAGGGNAYVFFRRRDGAFVRSPVFSRGGYVSGSLRLDAAPCWNRDGTEVVVPGIGSDGSRQMFLMRVSGARN